MKYKTLLVELSWIIAIYVVNFLVISHYINPQNILLPTLNINFDQTGVRVEGQGAFIPTFLVLLSLVYFIKEAIHSFKRQLQNYITSIIIFLAIVVLFDLNFIFNSMAMLITGMQQMSKNLSGLTKNLPNGVGDIIQNNLPVSPFTNLTAVAEKMPVIIIITQIALIIMLVICVRSIGLNSKKVGEETR